MKLIKSILLVFFSLIFLNILAAEPPKIAIICDTQEAVPLIDLITSKLIKEQDISIYDRKTLNTAILANRLDAADISSANILKINKILMVDYILCISSYHIPDSDKQIVRPSGITLFDARNGYRLLSNSLPEDSSQAANFTAEKIHKTLNEIKSGKTRKFISVVSVRNNGIAEKYNPFIAQLAATTERRLAESPDIAIPERTNLTGITKAPNPDKEIYKLTPSATLLAFEAIPGQTAATIDLIVHILNSNEEELGKKHFKDVLSLDKTQADKIAAELANFLKIKIPAKSDSEKEADRFGEEYNFNYRLGKRNIAKQKLETCIALSPFKPEYQYSWMASIMENIITIRRNNASFNPKELTELFIQLKKGIEIADIIKERVPDYKFSIYTMRQYIPGQVFVYFKTNAPVITDEVRQKAEDFTRLYTDRVFAEKAKYKITEIKTYRDLINYIGNEKSKISFEYYLSNELMEEAANKNAVNIALISNKFFTENPQLISSIKDQDINNVSTIGHNYSDGGYIILYNTDVTNLLKQSPIDYVKVNAYYLDFIRDFSKSNQSPAILTQLLDTMFLEMGKLQNIKTILLEHPSLNYEGLLYKFYNHKDFIDIFLEKLCAFYKSQGLTCTDPIILTLIRSKSQKDDLLASDIIKFAEEIKLIQLTQNDIDSKSFLASEITGNSPKEMQAIKILTGNTDNKLFSIKRIGPENTIYISGTEYKGKIYILTAKLKTFSIYEYTPETEQLNILVKDIKAVSISEILKQSQFIVNEKYFFISGYASILVISREDGSSKIIGKLPGKCIHGIALLDNRIYAFLCKNKEKEKASILFSCDYNGNDRKINISTEREEKINIFDKESPFDINGLWGDEKGKRLLLVKTGPNQQNGLFEFIPDKNEGRLVLGPAKFTFANKDGAYINIGNQDEISRFNIQNNTTDFIAGKDNEFLKDLNGKILTPQIKTRYTLRPFMRQGNNLWIFPDISLIKLPDIDKTIRIRIIKNRFTGISETLSFTDSDNNSALFITNSYFLKVTPLQEAKDNIEKESSNIKGKSLSIPLSGKISASNGIVKKAEKKTIVKTVNTSNNINNFTIQKPVYSSSKPDISNCNSDKTPQTSSSIPLKIAIIPDNQDETKLTDLISSRIINNSAVNLYDRNSLNQILKEHKLQTAGMTSNDIILIRNFLHLDYIVYISTTKGNDKKTIPSGIILFDAKNGYRLLNKALPHDLETAAQFATEEITEALTKISSGKTQKLVSVLSVRNAGIPAKYNHRLTQLAGSVERKLADIPDIAILERANLGKINQERTLSNEIYTLAQSATLLDFEAVQGTEKDKVILNIYILNVKGNEQGKIKIEDMLNPQINIENEIIKQLTNFLKMEAPSLNVKNLADEAERFFGEYNLYKRLNKWDIARQKIETVIALAPNKPEYYRELIYTILEEGIPRKPHMEYSEKELADRFAALQEAINLADMVKLAFPAYKPYLYNYIEYISRFEYNFKFKNKSVTPNIEKLTADFLKEYRERSFAEYHDNLLISHEMKSLKNLHNYIWYCNIRSLFSYYLSNQAASDARNKLLVDFFSTINNFFNKNPQMLDKISYEDKYKMTILTAPDIDRPFTFYNEEVSDCMKASPVDCIKINGLCQEFMRKFYQSDRSPKIMKNLLEETYAEMDKLDISKYKIENYSVWLGCEPINESILNNKELNNIFLDKLVDFYRKHGEKATGYSFLWLLSIYKNKELAELIVKFEPEITAMQQISKFDSSFKTLPSKISGNSDIEKQALNILSSNKAISTGSTKKQNTFTDNKAAATSNKELTVTKIDSIDIAATTYHSGKIYILTYKARSLTISELDTVKDTLNILFSNITSPFNDYYISSKAFAANDNFFVIGGDESILVISRKDGSIKIINDLPAKHINAITIFKNRIYAFIGEMDNKGNSPKETVLFSCTPDDSNRTINISTTRKEKLNQLDKRPPFMVRELFGDELNNRLLFATYGGLIEFDPDTNKYEIVIQIKGGLPTAKQIGNYIYISNASILVRFNIQNNKIEYIAGTGAKNIQDSDNNFVYPLFLNEFKNPRNILNYLNQNSQIWASSPCRLIKAPDFNNPIKIEAVEPRDASEIVIYPAPDGISGIFITRKNVFKVTPLDTSAAMKALPTENLEENDTNNSSKDIYDKIPYLIY